jgi:hypothetical protein
MLRSGGYFHLELAARTLGYLVPTPGVLRSVAEAVVRGVISKPLEDLFFVWRSKSRPALDDPLMVAMENGLPANEAMVRDTVVEELRDAVSRGNRTAEVLWHRLFSDVSAEEDWPSDLEDTLRRFGPGAAFLSEVTAPLVKSKLTTWPSVDPRLFIDGDLPWVSRRRWTSPLRSNRTGSAFKFLDLWRGRGSELLLQLLDLEFYERRPELYDVSDAPPLMFDLVNGRNDDQARRRALATMSEMDVPEEVRHFLDRWMRREFDVIR